MTPHTSADVMPAGWVAHGRDLAAASEPFTARGTVHLAAAALLSRGHAVARAVWALATVILGLCAALPATAVTRYRVDPAASTLDFTARLNGAPVKGRFTRFAAEIDFAPDQLATSRFEVTVETASVDTWEEARDAELRGPEFFASARYPTARFVSTSFERTGPERFIAVGQLTLRDVTRKIRLPFRFTPASAPPGTQAQLAGTVRLNRLDYGVGQGEWQDTAWVADEVEIRFSLHLEREREIRANTTPRH